MFQNNREASLAVGHVEEMDHPASEPKTSVTSDANGAVTNKTTRRRVALLISMVHRS